MVSPLDPFDLEGLGYGDHIHPLGDHYWIHRVPYRVYIWVSGDIETLDIGVLDPIIAPY